MGRAEHEEHTSPTTDDLREPRGQRHGGGAAVGRQEVDDHLGLDRAHARRRPPEARGRRDRGGQEARLRDARLRQGEVARAVASDATQPLLSVKNVEVIYDHVILVLKGVSLSVPEGGIVALLGANGAGKSTTLKAISGLLNAERGEVTKGSIEFRGNRVDKLNPSELVKRGVIQVMEGRH